MANWSDLPKDVLLLIAERLDSYFDVLHSRSVCSAWRSSVPFDLRLRPAICFPFRRRDGSGKSLLYRRSICLFEFPADLTQTTPRYWLAILEETESGRKSVLDPIQWRKLKPVQSPTVLDISKINIRELVRHYSAQRNGNPCTTETVACLNVNPNNDDNFYLMESDDEFYRLVNTGDEGFIRIGVDFEFSENFIQFKGNFYSCDDFGRTICIEPCSGAKSVVSEAFAFGCVMNWLVESSCGNLLLIEWVADPELGILTPEPLEFRVYQFDEERKKWVNLESLGDRIVFLVNECRFSANAIPGVEGNCIVYSFVGREHVYHLSSGKTVPLVDRPDLVQLFNPSPFFC